MMRPFTFILALTLAGCGGTNGNDGNGGNGGNGGGSADMATDPCTRGALEADLQQTPWQGPGVDASGNLKTGSYVVSTTYLRLMPSAMTEFMQLIGPIQGRLQKQQGLVAVRFGQSASCVSARTLAVWQDVASMYDFVGSPEHSAAAAKVGDVSRGGSTVTHFADDGSGATFANVAIKLSSARPLD